MIKAVFFDLDGTLLPFDEEKFIQVYFSLLYEKVKHQNYDKQLLFKTLYNGLVSMYKNDGSQTNEKVFWDNFKNTFGEERLKDKELFDDFYKNEFSQTYAIYEKNPLAREIIDFCKKNVKHVVLSTNPIFPKQATLSRMKFIGLNEEDFDLITTYEDCYYCKPNPMYFIDLLKRFNLNKDEVILFGNNTYEDGECALKAGIKTYIISGHIIDSPKSNHKFEIINMDQVIDTIKKYL